MLTPSPANAPAREIGKLAGISVSLWTVLIAMSLTLGLREQQKNIMKQAEEEAQTTAGMDLSFRNWIIGHGGIYVPNAGSTPSDTFLGARAQEIKTRSGQSLSLISHAYAMRQLSEARAKQGLPYGRLVSSKPKDPSNAPDEWERSALAGFESGREETLSLHTGSRVRFIRAFRLDATCLSCHTAEESPGGVRGAISVEVPLGDLNAIGGGLRRHWIIGHALLWLSGLLGILLAYKHLKRSEKDLSESEDKYRNLFETSQDALMTLAPPSWAFTSGNTATLAMFRAGSETEFISKGPQDLSPERQPDGRLSSEKAREMIAAALARGANLFEWTHRRITGEDFPADVLLTRMNLGDKVFLQATVRDISERKQEQAKREALLAELKETLAQVKYLSGLIPICASCKKIRNDKGEWETVEHYVTAHSDAKFSHGVCPDCGVKLYGKYYEEKTPENKKGG
ncbi:MAG: DUF3365 domain-containing protein [Elusimicrobiales bacterium]|nr:DUF3365 domain-containing protein [Elusimicrobiales bacterium]